VREWNYGELEPELAHLDQHSAKAGRVVFETASCVRCHAVNGEGGHTGPDLAEVVARRPTEELLAQVLEPSLEIAPEFHNEMFFMLDGTIHAGRVVREEAETAWVQEDAYSEKEPVEVPLVDVEERIVSNVSTMPSGLLSTFQRDEILDLFAYLRSLAPERKTQ